MKLYACIGSGNCMKPWLALHQLHRKFDLQLVDVLAGEQRTPDFLAINPHGVVPFLKTSNGHAIGESNAMIWYLTENTSLMPDSAEERAEALQWMFFEQSKLEPFISPARFFSTILPDENKKRAVDIQNWQSGAKPGLEVLEAHLQTREFMLRSGYSVADIAVFGYVHVLEEAGLSLSDYPMIKRWILEVENTTDFVSLSSMSIPFSHAA